MTIAENINILGNYCGKRDVEELTTENLQKKYNIPQADVYTGGLYRDKVYKLWQQYNFFAGVVGERKYCL